MKRARKSTASGFSGIAGSTLQPYAGHLRVTAAERCPKQASFDDGQTYCDASGNVRVIVSDVDVTADDYFDLHINVTDEGVILDLVGRDSEKVIKTAALGYADLRELMK